MALTDKLTAIANAIREKTGNTELLTLDQMPTEIAGIETGGGSGGGGASVIEALSVSATGKCTATKIEDGYVAVTVAVPTKNYNNAEGVNF